jgi:hypothetical protein
MGVVRAKAAPPPRPSVKPAAPAPSSTPNAAPQQKKMSDLPPNTITFQIIRANGHREPIQIAHNARVNAGASAIAQLIGSTAGTPFNYVALTSDSGAVVATDTTCPSEYNNTNGLGRKLATYGGYAAPASLGASASYTLTTSWTSSANAQNINKICAFNASSAGTLGFETILGATVTLNNGDTGNLTWTFNI